MIPYMKHTENNTNVFVRKESLYLLTKAGESIQTRDLEIGKELRTKYSRI